MPQLHSQRMHAVWCQSASVALVGAASGAVASLIVIGLVPRLVDRTDRR